MSADPTPFLPPVEPRRKAIPPRVWGPVILAILATVVATFAYAYHEHGRVKQLTAEKDEMAASLDAAHSLVAALTNRVSELSAKQSPGNPAARGVVNQSATQSVSSHPASADDPRWKEIQTQLAAQQKQIESMRNNRTVLQASIAHTHDELESLEKRTQRRYYEFDLGKSSLFRWQGPIALRLKKADAKHQYVDLEMIVGHDKVTRKHVPLYEPVFVFFANTRQSAELVVNGISDNRMHGYVSEAKYRSSGLEAMATPRHSTAGGTGLTAPAAPRLQPAKD